MAESALNIPILGEYGHIELTSKIANCLYILSLFYGKLAFNAYIKGPNRCIVVKYSPFIEWETATDRMLSEEKQMADIASSWSKDGNTSSAKKGNEC